MSKSFDDEERKEEENDYVESSDSDSATSRFSNANTHQKMFIRESETIFS
jgi:hypothetical protein